MTKLRVPSLQHLARNWRESPEQVQRTLVRLARNSPTFSYSPLPPAVLDLLLLKLPYDQVREGLSRAIKRPAVRENLLSILPLLDQHFRDESPDFVQAVATRYYPVARDLMIPFTPPLVYGVGGQLKFPWFSFWRSNPLAGRSLSLFVTLVDEVLQQDPDLEAADFQILDFSVPPRSEERHLQVVDTAAVPRLSTDDLKRMLAIFADGFARAKEELARDPKGTSKDQRDSDPRPPQPGLFD